MSLEENTAEDDDTAGDGIHDVHSKDAMMIK